MLSNIVKPCVYADSADASEREAKRGGARSAPKFILGIKWDRNGIS